MKEIIGNSDKNYQELIANINFKIVEDLLSFANKFYQKTLKTIKFNNFSGVIHSSPEIHKDFLLGIESYKNKYYKIGYVLKSNMSYHSINNQPSMIVTSFENNQIILNEIRYYKDNKIHHDSDLPAYFSFFADRTLRVVRYYKEGVLHRDPKNIKEEDTFIEDFALDAFHENGLIHQRRRYFNGIHHNLVNPSWYDFYPNGNLERIVYLVNNEKHRKHKPALIEYYENGDKARKMYFQLTQQGSVLYRDNGKNPHVRYCEEIKE